jgi:sigma-E factor negative regulatory protein RseB
MRIIPLLFLTGCFSSPAMAQVIEPAQSQPAITLDNNQTQPDESKKDKLSAVAWLNRMSQAIRELNFSASFVVVQNNRAEPYRWFHGVIDHREVEIVALLNGPRFEVIRRDKMVSYFEPNRMPYSVIADSISGPVPVAFSQGFEQLQRSYNFVSVGRSRILGRPARLVRIVAKDRHRHGYWVWIDEHSGLLLKAALVNRQGELLEQIQFTHLDITEQPAEALLQLQTSNLPAVVDIADSNVVQDKFAWRVTWLPQGFEVKEINRHTIATSGEVAEFMLFNDGLVDISVYVRYVKDENRPLELDQEGATTVLSLLNEGREISVVGKIPALTAKEIADAIHFVQ